MTEHGLSLQIKRPIVELPLASLEMDLLWSDPDPAVQPGRGYRPNARGAGKLFGPSEVRAFCRDNRLDLIVRAHQVKSTGQARLPDGRLTTLFSSSKYCGLVSDL